VGNLASRLYKSKDRYHKQQERLSAKKKFEVLDRLLNEPLFQGGFEDRRKLSLFAIPATLTSERTGRP